MNLPVPPVSRAQRLITCEGLEQMHGCGRVWLLSEEHTHPLWRNLKAIPDSAHRHMSAYGTSPTCLSTVPLHTHERRCARAPRNLAESKES